MMKYSQQDVAIVTGMAERQRDELANIEINNATARGELETVITKLSRENERLVETIKTKDLRIKELEVKEELDASEQKRLKEKLEEAIRSYDELYEEYKIVHKDASSLHEENIKLRNELNALKSS